MARVWGPRSISVKEAVEPLLRAPWLPEVDKLVISTFIEMSEGVQGAPWEFVVGGGVVPDGRAGAQRPAASGGFRTLLEDAARNMAIRYDAAVAAHRLERRRRAPRSSRAVEKIDADRALITVPLGLLRAGQPALDPLPPMDQQKAIGRVGYGAGILGKIYLRFPQRFWPEHPKWFGRLPDSPERRGTFNTWVSHEQETGLPILLSFANGATAAPP